ncbi:MAG: NADH-quinone oxidoreductase subunit, partial [Gammaproteobacteria bacterium]|nr:NADH-quinone oxidoreductase subunit [Gammaproteobacteria bacterium]
VENARKPVPACATPVTDGMRVFTKSEAARESQKIVMEFLLINHPLDCPVCDQGGQCELQDLAMGYGRDESHYPEAKRAVKDEDLGPLVATEMTRCIHCTRCVRFLEEIAGVPEMGGLGRGEDMKIDTYIGKNLSSELAGNIIELCPVGALVSKPFRFRARAWEMMERQAISPHDCVGSHIACHTLNNRVMRVVSSENESLNEIWLSDRDRFSYLGANSSDRLGKPQIKENGQWKIVDWATALNAVVSGFSKTLQTHGTEAVGVLGSSISTVEESYLLQKIFRHIGVNNIDHRVRESDFSDQDAFGQALVSDVSVKNIQNQEAILLVGANVRREQPVIGNRVRKATRRGYRVMSINPLQYEWHFPMEEEAIVSLMELPEALGAVAKAVLTQTHQQINTPLGDFIASCKTSELYTAMADHLIKAPHALLILGETALLHPDAALIRALAEVIKTHAKTGVMYLTQGGNSTGAWLAGLVPHRHAGGQVAHEQGLSSRDMLINPRKAYCFFQLDPELDCANPQQVARAVRASDFVVAIAPYLSELLSDEADVFLPITPFTETSGTFVNLEGRWQSFNAAVKPYDEARPGWKVLRVLGNLLEVPDCHYQSSEEIRDELRARVDAYPREASFMHYKPKTKTVSFNEQQLQRLGTWPLYGADNVVRRADALQKAGSSDGEACVRIAEKEALRLKVKTQLNVTVTQGDHSIQLPLVIDNRVPEGAAVILSGYEKTAALGESFGVVSIREGA